MAAGTAGIFEDWARARAAVERLQAAGIPPESISILGAEGASSAEPPTDPDPPAGRLNTTEEGAAIGAAAGGALGAAGGWVVGMAALTVPGVGPLLAAGPIFAAVAGLAAGAGTGGLLGALVGAGVPDEDQNAWADAVGGGRILVSVADPGHARAAAAILRESGAAALLGARPGAGSSESAPADPPDLRANPLREPVAEATAMSEPDLVPGHRATPLEVPGAHTGGVLPAPGFTGGVVLDPSVNARYTTPTSGAYEEAGPGVEVSRIGLEDEDEAPRRAGRD